MSDKNEGNADGEERGVTRRGFLKGVAAGAVAAGVLANTPALLRGSEGELWDASGLEALAGGAAPIVAYVRDVGNGEVAVMIGTREVVRRDLGLVARILSAGKE